MDRDHPARVEEKRRGRCRSKLDYDEVYRKSGITFHREKCSRINNS